VTISSTILIAVES